MLEETQTIMEETAAVEPGPGAEWLAEPVAHTQGQRIIAVASGKGGVGKTSIVANMGIALTRYGHRVLLMDTDFGMGNLELMIGAGVAPKYNLTHVFSGKKTLQDVMMTGPRGVRILPAGTGGKLSGAISLESKRDFMEEVRGLSEIADIVLVDTRSGLSDNTLHFMTLADEVILVTTPEPPSIMDSYGIVKILAQERDSTAMKLLINMAGDRFDALHVEDTIGLVTKQFSNVALEHLGWICHDSAVPRAVRQQQPFVTLYPHSRASKDVSGVAAKLVNYQFDMPSDYGFRSLINRLRSRF